MIPLPLSSPMVTAVFQSSKVPRPLTLRRRPSFHGFQLSVRTVPSNITKLSKPLMLPLKTATLAPVFTRVPAPLKVWPTADAKSLLRLISKVAPTEMVTAPEPKAPIVPPSPTWSVPVETSVVPV